MTRLLNFIAKTLRLDGDGHDASAILLLEH
jgi:hypothetical protein